ncbi:hypothetical protein [Amycolatopsis sp. NPDC004169]|uniref:hypothetical protein n=1 Tax=Amycolatopsis sp. NPDC004169 TaxID=3154453 RepID=UPI0033AC9F3A
MTREVPMDLKDRTDRNVLLDDAALAPGFAMLDSWSRRKLCAVTVRSGAPCASTTWTSSAAT